MREERLAWLLLLPSLSVVIGICLFPIIYNIYLSLHSISLSTLGERAEFVGLSNYADVLDKRFLSSLTITIIYSFFGVLLSLILGLLSALILNHRFYGRSTARAILLFPYIAPLISVAFIAKWMLNPVYGVGNWLFDKIGVISESIAWLSEEPLALICVICFEGWRYFAFDMLFILARLCAIPAELYESARIDGAGGMAQFFHITLPELKYILSALFLIRFLWTVNKFDDIFLLTGGSAGTEVLPILVYEYSFRIFDFGLGSACSVILSIFLIVSIFLYRRRYEG